VLLIGRDSDHFQTGLLVEHPELESRVHATGALDHDGLSYALQACDLMAQPYPDGASTRRGTLMAALAHGVPVVTTTGRLSEPLWAAGGDVVAVPAGDNEALTRAVVALARDGRERARLSEQGRRLYASRFDLSHTVESLLSDRCVGQ
jgi:glycosyltransferase involved in cell wall biosynthesis